MKNEKLATKGLSKRIATAEKIVAELGGNFKVWAKGDHVRIYGGKTGYSIVHEDGTVSWDTHHKVTGADPVREACKALKITCTRWHGMTASDDSH